MERQQVHESPEADALRALRRGGEEQPDVGHRVEWDHVMLGLVIAPESGVLGRHQQVEVLLIELAECHAVANLYLVEHAEAHGHLAIFLVAPHFLRGPRSRCARYRAARSRARWPLLSR